MVSQTFLEYLEHLSLVVGYDNVKKLCSQFAGEPLYIHAYKENCEEIRFKEFFEKIVCHIGEQNAKNLCKTFGGETVFFPKGFLFSQRNEVIKEEYQKGITYEQLSRKYGLTTRRIRDILETVSPYIPTEFESKQLPLF